MTDGRQSSLAAEKLGSDRLLALGFLLGDHLGGATEGAWRATAPHGGQVVLKWSANPGMVADYAKLCPSLNTLRGRGVPVARYLEVIPFEGGTLSVQQFLPGRSQDRLPPAVVAAIVGFIGAKAGIGGPGPADAHNWGGFVVQALRKGQDVWCAHAPLRDWGPASAAFLDRIEALGAAADPDWFLDDGLVHLDLHTDNILIEGDRVTGIIDWEGACTGDHLYDLVQFAFDLDGHDQSIWEIVDAAGLRPEVIRAYVALLVLQSMSAAILDRPSDMERQLARAERVFDRYGV